jgi:hypothetical protein
MARIEKKSMSSPDETRTFDKGKIELIKIANELKMNDSNYNIPVNATIRQEYVKCGNPDCQNHMAHISMPIGNKIRN